MSAKQRSASQRPHEETEEAFDVALTQLVGQIGLYSRTTLSRNIEEIPTILKSNAIALRLLNQAAQLVQNELNKCYRPKITAETEYRRALRRSAFSWELIPGLSCVKHNFTPLDVEEADRLVQLALKSRPALLIAGNSGQGKTMLMRYVLRKHCRTSILIDVRRAPDLPQHFQQFTLIHGAILVLDNVLPHHCDFILNNLSAIPSRSTLCVITASDEVVLQLSELMCTIKIPDPCQQHMAKMYSLLARCVHASPKFVVPAYRSRFAIVRIVQMELLDSHQQREDFDEVFVDQLPVNKENDSLPNKCLPKLDLRKIERPPLMNPAKNLKGKKGGLRRKPKKGKKKEKK